MQQTFTDTIKECTTRMLKEAEIQTPIQAQICSDMYKEYVHMLENAFEVLRHSEDGISRWSGMPPSPEAHAAFGSLAGKAADCWLAHLDSCGKTLQWYSGARTQAAKTYDRYVHSTINGYVQMIEQYAASSGNWWERWYAKRRPDQCDGQKEEKEGQDPCGEDGHVH